MSTLKGVAAKLAALPREIVDESVKSFDDIAMASVVRAIGGTTMNLHTRRGRRPVKMGTKSAITGDGAHVSVFINGTPSAQWTWLQSGTIPHDIGRGRYLHAPNYPHPIKGPIHHPGSRGQQVWTRAVTAFAAEFPKIGIAKLRTALDG